jgi:hypothetical protein
MVPKLGPQINALAKILPTICIDRKIGNRERPAVCNNYCRDIRFLGDKISTSWGTELLLPMAPDRDGRTGRSALPGRLERASLSRADCLLAGIVARR